MECFVTVVFAHILVGALASRHIMTANLQQEPSPAPSPSLSIIMTETDDAMNNVPVCQEPDRYFAESMIPHHQGAIRMAQWELNYGSNAQLLNISQSVITSQTNEVQKMKNYLTLIPGCASDSAPSSNMIMSPGMQMNVGSSMGMQMDMMSPSKQSSEAASSIALTPSEAAFANSMDSMMAPMPAPLTGNPDRDFALEMSKHHQAAIDMANVELKYGSYQPLLTMAHDIIASQSMELMQFKNILFVQYAVSA
ncbi:hypothetical protein CVIRNUC_002684 [Coccomyxa viridis]|uniref:DUF305 domain-containing protein n=1 Tax=Coccomyxa viridis TaxID=1274662 RepID=A0AAV1I046_9CHLO|nr:hypothetical protein CVIRNUC_002684 [Coccomyxa viridis]